MCKHDLWTLIARTGEKIEQVKDLTWDDVLSYRRAHVRADDITIEQTAWAPKRQKNANVRVHKAREDWKNPESQTRINTVTRVSEPAPTPAKERPTVLTGSYAEVVNAMLEDE